MSRVTGHKEPLCQVTEHREKDKGLEGCDMTNMRGSAGLRGDWHYSRGWLTLLICITHQSRSQRRRADKPHTWSPDAWAKTPAPAESPPKTRTFTQSSSRVWSDDWDKEVWFTYTYSSRQMTKACHQPHGKARLWRQMSISIKSPFLLLTKLLFLSLGERVQRSATSRIEWRTQRLANLSGFRLQRSAGSDESKGANDRLALSSCHYHQCQRKEGSFFFFLIIAQPPSPPRPINNASEEYDLFLWGFWMAPNVFLEAKQWRASPVCQLLGLIRRWHCWLMLQTRRREGWKYINFQSEKKILSS